MLVRVCELLASEPGPPFSERVVGLQGRKRPYFSSSGAELRSPIQIPGLDLFVEGNISAHQAERLARRTVETIKGPDHSFSVELVGESASASKPTSTMGAPDTRSPPPTSESFTGLRPGAYFLDGKRHEVTRWNEVLLGICNRLAKETGSDFGKFVSSIRGTTRLYFSESAEKLHSPLRLSNSTVYVEGKFSANDCVRLARRVLVSVRGSDEGFRIEPEGASKT